MFQILAQVLSYLWVDNLKNIRLVSKLWNAEGFKLLKKRAFLYLPRRDAFEGDRNQTNTNVTMRLFRYDHEMGHNPLNNCHVRLPSFDKDIIGGPCAKIIDDFDSIFSKFCHITRLKIDLNVKCQLDYDVRLKILTNLSNTLQDLDLSGKWRLVGKDGTPINYSFPRGLIFNRLQTLTISLEARDRNGGYVHNFSWFHALIPAIPAVNNLDIDDASFAHVLLYNLNLCPNFTHICTHYICSKEFWERFLSLDNPLKSLSIGYIFEDEGQGDEFLECIRLFEQVLVKHATTLECLQFTIPENTGSDCVLHIPPMPALKILSIGCEFITKSVKEMRLLFGRNEELNFSRHFPSLQSLTLDPCVKWRNSTIWTAFCNFYESFLPVYSDTQICKTVKYLDIGHYCGRGLPGYYDDGFGDIEKMFPNASNQRTNEDRKAPRMWL